MEAFVDVGAAGGFADGVEVERAQSGFELVEGFEMGVGTARPFGEARARGVDLDQWLGQRGLGQIRW